MRTHASALVKRVLSALVAALKAKSMALKSRANAMKTRLIIFWLLRNKNFLMSSISHKIHALISREKGGAGSSENYNKAMLVLPHGTTAKAKELPQPTSIELEGEGLAGYDTLLEYSGDEERELSDDSDSVVDPAGNSSEEHHSNSSIQDEIDHMAEEFIRRFHRQMRMEKQD